MMAQVHMSDHGWGLHIPVLQWALDNSFPLGKTISHRAAAIVDLSLLKSSLMRMPLLRWLRASKCPWGKEACLTAAYHVFHYPDDTQPLRFLVENGCRSL